MAVGLVSLPFALVYAVAAQAGGRLRILLPLLAGCGFVAAFWVWRRMGDWQVKPKVSVSQFEDCWAALLKTTIESGAPHQYRATVDEDTLRTWNEVLAPTLFISEFKTHEHALNQSWDAATKTLHFITAQPTLMDQTILLLLKTEKPSAPSGITSQSTSALALALGQQMLVGAHGLA